MGFYFIYFLTGSGKIYFILFSIKKIELYKTRRHNIAKCLQLSDSYVKHVLSVFQFAWLWWCWTEVECAPQWNKMAVVSARLLHYGNTFGLHLWLQQGNKGGQERLVHGGQATDDHTATLKSLPKHDKGTTARLRNKIIVQAVVETNAEALMVKRECY